MRAISKNHKGGTLIKDLTEGPVLPTLLSFSIPIVVSGVLQLAYNLVDMIVVGQFVGKIGLSAVSNGGDLLHFLTFLAFGFSNAAQIIISKYVGAGDKEKLGSIIGSLFTFLFITAAVLTGFCLICRTRILDWIRIPDEARNEAADYMMVCIAGLVFVYGYNCVSAVLRGMGDSKHPMLFIGLASVLNVALDLVFVGVLDMRSMGAALATIIGQAVSFIFAMVVLYRRRKDFYFDFAPKSFRIRKDSFPELVRLGVPMMFQFASVNFSKLFIASWVNSYGVTLSALSGIGTKLENVVGAVTKSLGTGGASMTSQSIGAKEYNRVSQIMKSVFLINVSLSIIMSALTIIWPEMIFGVFTDDVDVLALSSMYIPVAVVLYLGCTLRATGMVMINGSGRPKINLTLAFVDGIVIRIGFAYFLGIILDMGIHGFWYGNAFAGWVPFIIGVFFLIQGEWRK